MGQRLKDSAIGGVIIVIYAVSALTASQIPFLIHFALLFGILFHGHLLGKRLFQRSSAPAAAAMGVCLFLGLLSLVQTACFYLNVPLGHATDAWTVAFSMILCHALTWRIRISNIECLSRALSRDRIWNIEMRPKRLFFAVVLSVCSITSAAFVLFGAFKNATLSSIRTPWPLMPHGTLLALALAWAAVALTSLLVKSRALTAAQAGLALFATTSIAPLIYRLGFGFDGFLHIVAEKILLATGALSPKPFYYIGQYVFTTWISRAADVPIESVDRWLVPVSVSILLPLAFYVSRGDKRGLSFLFLIPLAPFVATTPQSFSYVLGLAALFLAFERREGTPHWLAPLLLAAWSAAVHPLAGVPFLLVTLALIFSGALAWIFALGSATAVPMLFYALSLNGGAAINWNLSALFSPEPWTQFLSAAAPWLGNKFVFWPALATLVSKALPLGLLAGAVCSAFLEPKGKRRPTAILIAASAALFISSVVLKGAGEFAFLIDYERGNYADRLQLLGIFCLIPAALPALSRISETARAKQPLLGLALFAAFLTIAAAQSYNSLPRHDALVTGRGWSVGRADVDAVRWIDRDAAGQDYTVLSNQSVSAAAVSQFGFKRYHGDVFFYPIPTGGPLYEIFLRLTYRETAPEPVLEAAKLGGTTLVYVVLNDYWWNAEKVGEELSDIAAREWSFGESDKGLGKNVRVYKFDVSKPIKSKTEDSGS